MLFISIIQSAAFLKYPSNRPTFFPFFPPSNQDNEPPTTLAGLLTTSGYSNDITNNTNSIDGKSSSRESRGESGCAAAIRLAINPSLGVLGRSVGGGPMRSRSRNIDTSPYSSTNTAYLSPPDNTWRRTSSDSAIHQSLGQSAQVSWPLTFMNLESRPWRSSSSSGPSQQSADAQSAGSQTIVEQPKQQHEKSPLGSAPSEPWHE